MKKDTTQDTINRDQYWDFSNVSTEDFEKVNYNLRNVIRYWAEERAEEEWYDQESEEEEYQNINMINIHALCLVGKTSSYGNEMKIIRSSHQCFVIGLQHIIA